MIAVGADDVQVIVFAANAYAFLRIGRCSARRNGLVQENVFELQKDGRGLLTVCIRQTAIAVYRNRVRCI